MKSFVKIKLLCLSLILALFSLTAQAKQQLAKLCVYNESGGNQSIRICLNRNCNDCGPGSLVGFLNPSITSDGSDFRVCGHTGHPIGRENMWKPISSRLSTKGLKYLSVYSAQGYSTRKSEYDHCVAVCNGKCSSK